MRVRLAASRTARTKTSLLRRRLEQLEDRTVPDGSLSLSVSPISYDTTWGNSGWVGSGTLVGALAVQADGKLVVAGSAAGQGTNYYDFTVSRFLTNGQRDTTFGGPYGTVTTDLTGQKDLARAV